MMKKILLSCSAFLVLSLSAADASDRYKNRGAVIVSQDLTAPWVMQLSGNRAVVRTFIAPGSKQAAVKRRFVSPFQIGQTKQMRQPVQVQQVGFTKAQRPIHAQISPQFLPQEVAYETPYKAGTIVIDSDNRFLYLVLGNGMARRYGVGVGKPGFEWAGAHRITRKAEWPDWTPPAQMISREAAKGHFLPARMDGGVENPLGSRAMYIGNTQYRIHGTNAPWTIGYAVSSGCIRMRNQDVEDLYERVQVGAKVVVQ
jgi:lipoprotein-anchoring transpeptidase ErfK/SrfK